MISFSDIQRITPTHSFVETQNLASPCAPLVSSPCTFLVSSPCALPRVPVVPYGGLPTRPLRSIRSLRLVPWAVAPPRFVPPVPPALLPM